MSELDIKFFESLFKKRIEISTIQMPPNEGLDAAFDLVQEIPLYDQAKLNLIITELRLTKDAKLSLANIGYDYLYDSTILRELLEKGEVFSQKPSDCLVVLICYQLISCIYFNRPIVSANDFQLLIQYINFLITSKLSYLVQSAFRLLIHNVKNQGDDAVWTKDNIALVFSFFNQNMNLPNSFYSLFIEFTRHMLLITSSDLTIRESAASLIYRFLHQKRDIIKVKDLSSVFEVIHPLLAKLNKNALFSLDEISKIQPKLPQLHQAMNMLPPIFASKAKQTILKIDDSGENIHNFQAIITDHPPQPLSFDYIEIDTFSQKLNGLPAILSLEPFLLFNGENIAKEHQSLSALFKEFVEMLNRDFVNSFFDEMISALSHCRNAECYGVFATFLLLLYEYGKNEICESYLPFLFDEFLFNPKTTVFGPKPIDNKINMIRSAIVDLLATKAPRLLIDFLKYFLNQPFLFAEIIGRYYYKVPIELMQSDEVFKLISEVCFSMQKSQLPADTRSAVFTYVLQYFYCPLTSLKCISSQVFINSFLYFILEKGLTEILLFALQEALIAIDVNQNLEYQLKNLVEFLFIAVENCDQINQPIFSIILNVSTVRPKFVPLFEKFLDLMMTKFSKNPTEISYRSAVSFLSLVSSSHDGSYSIDSSHFVILAENIEFLSENTIFNLIGSGSTFNESSVFLMKKSAFLPLLFIKWQKTPTKMREILQKLYKNASYSSYNCRAMHDGKIDLLLLHFLNNDMPIQINGFSFEFAIPEIEVDKTVIPLLKLICLSKSGNEVAKYFTKAVTLKYDRRMYQIFSSILSSTNLEPRPQFQIGNINKFCIVSGLDSSVFTGNFSISFMLKIDPALLVQSTSMVLLISFISPHSNQRLSISLINGVLYASYERDRLHTMVSLCQRMIFNKWSHYTLLFTQDENGCRIMTIRDFERLHDSDFSKVNFEGGPISIVLGGYKYEKRKIKFYGQQCGSVANIKAYNRLLTQEEFHTTAIFSDQTPNDYFFASSDFGAEISKQSFDFLSNRQKLRADFSRHCYKIEKIENCIHNFCRYFVDAIQEAPEDYIDNLIILLKYAIISSKDSKLSPHFSSILFHIPDKIKYHTFINTIYTINAVKDQQIRFYWLEDVAFNFALWEKSLDFSFILKYLNENIDTYSEFLKQKNYFPYFLICFNKHVNNKKIHDLLLIFLARCAHIHLTSADCDLLFSYLANTNNRIEYLNLIINLHESILKIEYPADNLLLSYLKNTEIDDVLTTLFALHCLCPSNFHTMSVTFLQLIILDKKVLFSELEKHVDKYPNLFTLTCAIALSLNLEKITVIPHFVTRTDMWFVFPLLFAMNSDIDSREGIFNFVCSNAVLSVHLDVVISLTALLSITVNHSDFDPLELLLNGLIDSSREYSVDVLFCVFFNTVSSVFYHLNGKIYHDQISTENNIVEPIEKITLSALEHVFSYFERDFSSLSYNFHIELKDEELLNVLILIKALSLADSLLEIELNDVKKTKSGIIFSRELPQFTMDDFYKLLFYFKSYSHHMVIKSIEEFEKMNLIFEWMKDKLNSKFKSDIPKLSKGIQMMFELPEIRKADKDLMVKFENVEIHRVAELLDLVHNDVKFVRDSSLNINFYPHLIKRKKQKKNFDRYNIDKIFTNSKEEGNEGNKEIKCNRILYKNVIPLLVSIDRNGISYRSANSSLESTKNIPIQDLKSASYVNETTVLIVKRENKSYLFDFGRKSDFFFYNLTSITEKLSHTCFIAPKRESLLNSFWWKHNAWLNNSVSTFDYLNLLNMFVGRTFMDANHYPLFPSIETLEGKIGDESKLPKLTKTFFEDEDKSEKGDDDEKDGETLPIIPAYTIPETYFLFEGRFPQIDVYKNRRQIESSKEIVQKFIVKNFSDVIDSNLLLNSNSQSANSTQSISSGGTNDINIANSNTNISTNSISSLNNIDDGDIGINTNDVNEVDSTQYLTSSNATKNEVHLNLNRASVHPQELRVKTTFSNSDMNNSPKILYASVLKLQSWPNAFCFAYSDGHVAFFNVTFDDGGNAKCDIFGAKSFIENSFRKGRFTYIDSGIIAFCNHTMYTVNQYGHSEEKNIYFEQILFAQNIYLRTPSIIAYSARYGKSFFSSTKDLYQVKQKVTCLAMNQRNNIFAVGCDDCKVRIRNLASGKKIATLKTENEVPKEILITEKWGFVIVKTAQNLIVFSSNGTALRKCADFPKFIQWSSFDTLDGFDYICFEDENHGLHYCEAMVPEERTKIMEIQSKIIKVHFDQKWNSFLVVTDQNSIMILPRV